MRLAFVTDQHFDINSRFEETVRIHRWIADDAAERGCTLTLLGGDLFEKKSVPEDRNAAGEWLLRMAQFGPVLGVYGNHEIPGDADLFNLLEAPHPVRIHARPVVEVVQGVAIACLPWPRKAHLLASFGDAGIPDIGNAAQHHLRSILRGLGSELDQYKGAPRVSLAHVMIDGAKTDHDQPMVGADMAVSLADLSLLRCDAYLCGHVHAQQCQQIGEAPCFYGGSPRHNNFGEPGPKGYVVVEFDGAKLVSWERIATPATPMFLLEGRWENGGIVMNAPLPDVRGGEVRLRYAVPADEREAAKAAAQRLCDHMEDELGAEWVKPEPEVHTTKRARAPEVARATTIEQKLPAHWASISFDPGDRRNSLLSKATELEEEVRLAS